MRTILSSATCVHSYRVSLRRRADLQVRQARASHRVPHVELAIHACSDEHLPRADVKGAGPHDAGGVAHAVRADLPRALHRLCWVLADPQLAVAVAGGYPPARTRRGLHASSTHQLPLAPHDEPENQPSAHPLCGSE